jgi:hypothetical protein
MILSDKEMKPLSGLLSAGLFCNIGSTAYNDRSENGGEYKVAKKVMS